MPRKITIKNGLDLPINGAPTQEISESEPASTVALLGDDYIGLRPTMLVKEGDTVKLGQPVFTDKTNPGVQFTAPASGEVIKVRRGAKRKFESLEIQVSGDDQVTFETYGDRALSNIGREKAASLLVESGLWTAFRQRPFGKVPPIDSTPRSIFVTAIDTNPLAADPAVVIAGQETEFIAGLEVLSNVTNGAIFVCRAPGANIPGDDVEVVETAEFAGPHPAGLPGTHISYLDPANAERISWYINYQDVIAMGHLFNTGKLDVSRVIAIGGPAASNPRLIRTQLGANVVDLTADEKSGDNVRVIAGSVFNGRTSDETQPHLGRYHSQVSILTEGNHRELLGWAAPGLDKFSVKPTFLSAIVSQLYDTTMFDFTTNTQGSPRAIIPTGAYEKVMALDIEPTALLKALVVEDLEYAQELGALELEEEDLALCTFVDTGKHDFGTILRKNLNRIEIEG
ncbi:MAG: NADH:ubiquinone reductase (Na(+)-transporting) subunit A [Blastopirellula sp.]|nr:MAG: NADH:ubiquinone reductase (Na(+)-transporting) subunit A [Blastopirellula sp.]